MRCGGGGSERMTQPAAETHETNLDFIRALAVLMVVCSHLAWFFGDPHLSFFQPAILGKLGVIIFFVHSGIVNMLSIERQVDKRGTYRLFRAFMTRRCFRIYPLSIAVVSIIFLAKVPAGRLETFGAVTIGQHARLELLPSLLLVQNFLRLDQIVGPLWSLPYEVQIYCLFPILYLALRRFNSAKVLLFAWSLLAAVDYLVAPHFAKHADLGHFVTVPDLLFYFILFLPGLYAYKEMQTSQRVVGFGALPALLALICSIWCLGYDQTRCVFVTFCLGLALPWIKSCNVAALNRVCGWVAKYSYGIYLLHFPAIWLAFIRMGHFPRVIQGIAFLLATLGGSVLAYHALEHPMIVIGNRAAAAISESKNSVRLHRAAAAAGVAG
jgi:peptidoglycan/LPS O-acetylase OafA/YrhL